MEIGQRVDNAPMVMENAYKVVQEEWRELVQAKMDEDGETKRAVKQARVELAFQPRWEERRELDVTEHLRISRRCFDNVLVACCIQTKQGRGGPSATMRWTWLRFTTPARRILCTETTWRAREARRNRWKTSAPVAAIHGLPKRSTRSWMVARTTHLHELHRRQSHLSNHGFPLHGRIEDRKAQVGLGTSSEQEFERTRDEKYMRLALEEARQAFRRGEVPVGAVAVDADGRVIAQAHNLVETENDPTAHAEILCLRQAAMRERKAWRLLGVTLYVTLEPCVMCAGAILQARIDRIVYGANNSLLGGDGSWLQVLPRCSCDGTEAGETKTPTHPFHTDVRVSKGVLVDECADIMREFFRMRRSNQDFSEGGSELEVEVADAAEE